MDKSTSIPSLTLTHMSGHCPFCHSWVHSARIHPTHLCTLLSSIAPAHHLTTPPLTSHSSSIQSPIHFLPRHHLVFPQQPIPLTVTHTGPPRFHPLICPPSPIPSLICFSVPSSLCLPVYKLAIVPSIFLLFHSTFPQHLTMVRIHGHWGV